MDVYISLTIIHVLPGFIGETRKYLSGETLTAKMHTFRLGVEGAILILRNPFKAMVAEFNRRHSGKTGHVKEKVFSTPGIYHSI